METIKNYLDAMFRNLPQNEKVYRAKSELFQMMEDKYTELIREGKTENEAVGTVISEFGNLEDLADDLGIKEFLVTSRTENINRRKVTFDEVTAYLKAKKEAAFIEAGAIMLCICCPIGPIIGDALHHDTLGIIGIFLMIACAVTLFIMNPLRTEGFNFIKNEPCTIDSMTRENILNQKREFISSYSVRLSLGIMLCVLCFVPAIIFDNKGFLEEFAACLLFIFVGAGVFLIVSSNKIKNTYDKLLNLNNKVNEEFNTTMESNNPRIKAIMSAYWSTVTCIYLCVSFLTHCWHISWLIWPIAGALSAVITAITGISTDTKHTKEN